MNSRRPNRLPDEQGGSLVVALAFVSIFSVVIGAALDFAGATYRLDRKSQDATAELYGVNGALDQAIDAIRDDLASGISACATTTLVLDDGRTATVTCTPEPGSGGGSGSEPGAVAAGAPDHALLTTSASSEAGISIDVSTLVVDGPVVASSNISATSGVALDSGLFDVHYEFPDGGACNTTNIPKAVCSFDEQQEIDDAIEKVGQPSWIITTARTAPACSGDGGYYALSPGVYDNAAALTALTSGGEDCAGSVVHLLPGKFVFNFSQDGYGAQWRITDPTAVVIAGTANEGNSACLDGNLGSLLSFIGESALFVGASSTVEFCGMTQSNGQKIAIFGPSLSDAGNDVQSECIALAKGCPFIMVTDSNGNAQGTGVLRVHGTVLALDASIGLNMSAGVVAEFNRGALVRSVYVLTGDSVKTVFSTLHDPSSGGLAPRGVVLTVTIDGGPIVGRAKVEFHDGNGGNGAIVKVLEWDSH